MSDPQRTFFGLPILEERLVAESDIARLPFYDFWRESHKGSAMMLKDGKTFVYLHDWEAFCRLFITTGRHRFMPQDDAFSS